jgi:hypothetical protein
LAKGLSIHLMNKALAFILFLLIVFSFRGLSLDKYEEIEVETLFIGEEAVFSSPLSESHSGVIVTNDQKGEINFAFKEPISFDSFSLFFKGNLHSVSSYLAEDFDVYYRDQSDGWRKIDEVRGNRSSVYRFYSPVTLFSDALKILVAKAPFFDTVAYGDLKFYRQHKVGFVEGIKNFLFEQRKTLLSYLFYTFLFYVFLLIPGYTILNLKDSESKIVFAPIVTIVLLFLLALIYLLVENPKILNFYWLIFIFTFFIFLKDRLYREVFSSKFLLFSMGAVLAITLFVQAQRDYLFNLPYIETYLDQLEIIPLRGGYYGYHSDNTSQWRLAKLFLHKMPIFGPQTEDYLMGFEPEQVLDRTPLLPMVTMVILHFFGDSHFIYQRFLSVLAALYYGGTYLFLKSYFSRKVAKINFLLLLLNVPLTFLTYNAEVHYKYFAIYPLFLAFSLFFKEKDEPSILIGLLIGIGFLIHPMTLIPSAVLFLLYYLRYRLTPKFFYKIAAAFLILIFLLGGWTLITRFLKSEAGIRSKGLYLEKITTIHQGLIKNKLGNLVGVFVPEKIQLSSRNFWIPVIRFSIIFNLTPVMFFLFLIYFRKRSRKNGEILLMAILPLLFYLISFPDYAPTWHFMLYPLTIPCFLGYITSRLMEEKRLMRSVAFGGYAFFMLISLYFLTGISVEMKHASLVVTGLSWAIGLSYLLLSSLLIKLGYN